VDFPVFDGFCKAAGLGLLRTKDPLVSLHRAAIVYGGAPSPALARAFRRHHVRHDLGQEFIDLRLTGQQLLAAKNYPRMARVFRKLVAFEPRSSRAHYLLGIGCFRASQNQLAIRYLRRGRRLDKHKVHDFDFYLGCAYAAVTRDEEARRAFKRSLRREPRATAFAMLGSTYVRLGKIGRARTCLKNALALDLGGTAAEELKRNLDALPKRRMSPSEQHAAL
jgi:tetratricopeptide (TPR) repeat protein